jgi:TolB-like protein/Flp pilus assembly protein TadD
MSMIAELKRRNVFRVGIAYVLMGWVLLQGADFALDLVDAPNWVIQALSIAVITGLPIALFFAWVFEMTPEGIKRESQIDRSQSITPHTGRKLNNIIIVFLAVAVAWLLADKFFLQEISTPQQTGAEIAQAKTGAPAESEPLKQSIAVLPFANRSRSEDDVFFVDGVHDDLLTQLSKVSALKVISRTSVMNYRETDKSLPVIGKELGVSTIMEGSVQRAGDRIRINVQLIDAATDEHLWAEIYDRELTASNIFEIQSEIATAIAGALRAALTREEAERLAARPTENLEAYEAYLLGRQRLARRTIPALAEAVTWFERAVELDPDFALAYVGLADSYQLQVDYGGMSLDEANAHSQPMVEKALQLDDQSGEAYTSLASIREFVGDYEAADRAYRRAIELAPNYAQAPFWYGLFLMNSRGLPEQSLEWFQRALELDPLSGIVLSNLSGAYEMLGQFDEAHAVTEKALAMDPDFLYIYQQLAYLARSVDAQYAEAVEWLLHPINREANDPAVYGDFASIFGELGDDVRAGCWAEKAVILGPDSSYANLAMMRTLIHSGDLPSAETHARVAIKNSWVVSLKSQSIALVATLRQREGEPGAALDLYRENFPNLFTLPQAGLNRTNHKAAIDLAQLLLNMGREAKALKLLDEIELYIRDVPLLGDGGYGVDRAKIHVLRGDTESALAELEQIVQSGWRYHWRFYLEFDPVLEPLRDEPRFQALVDQIRADMSEQLEQVLRKYPQQDLCG